MANMKKIAVRYGFENEAGEYGSRVFVKGDFAVNGICFHLYESNHTLTIFKNVGDEIFVSDNPPLIHKFLGAGWVPSSFLGSRVSQESVSKIVNSLLNLTEE